MAEAAGLALGGIALASLITTCVEFVEYFENGRNYARDLTLAITKVKLMITRLYQLGELKTMMVQPEPLDDPKGITMDDWDHVADVLPVGVSWISDIVRRTNKLCSKYSHGQDITAPESVKITTRFLGYQKSGSSGSKSRRGSGDGRPVLHTIAMSLTWAFHDKRKCEGLVSDLETILSSLEKITEHMNAKTKQHQEVLAEGNKPNTAKKMAYPQGRRGTASYDPEPPAWGQSASNSAMGIVGYQTRNRPVAYSEPNSARTVASTQVAVVENRTQDQSMQIMATNTANCHGNVAEQQGFFSYGTTDIAALNNAIQAWQQVATQGLRQRRRD